MMSNNELLRLERLCSGLFDGTLSDEELATLKLEVSRGKGEFAKVIDPSNGFDVCKLICDSIDNEIAALSTGDESLPGTAERIGLSRSKSIEPLVRARGRDKMVVSLPVLGAFLAASLLIVVTAAYLILSSQSTEKATENISSVVALNAVLGPGSGTVVPIKNRMARVPPNRPFHISVDSKRDGIITVIKWAPDGQVAIYIQNRDLVVGPEVLRPDQSRTYFVLLAEGGFTELEAICEGHNSASKVREVIWRYIQNSDNRWFGFDEITIHSGEQN